MPIIATCGWRNSSSTIDRNSDPRPEIRLLTNWRDFLVLARTEAKPGMSPDFVESMRKVYLRHPQPPILLRYALMAGLNGRPTRHARQ